MPFRFVLRESHPAFDLTPNGGQRLQYRPGVRLVVVCQTRVPVPRSQEMTRKPAVLPRVHPPNLPQPGKLLASHVEQDIFGSGSFQNLSFRNPLINLLGSSNAQNLLQLLELRSLEVTLYCRRYTPTFTSVESGLYADRTVNRQFRFARELSITEHRHTEPAEVLGRFQRAVLHVNEIVKLRIS